MKKTVGVITDDPYLFQKIKRALSDVAEVSRGDGGVFDMLIVDRAASDAPADLVIARGGECDLKIPFTYADLLRAVEGGEQAALAKSDTDRCALLHGKRIKLTELEYSLFSYLFDARRFVGKDELLKDVFSGGSNDGIVNVYVHYLREKLEAHGEKVIICSRMQGYRIDEKYL